jgi:hypothetical protein
MKRITLLLLLVTSFAFTGCIKELLKKKDEEKTVLPEEKYYGTTWKATKIAQDANGNNQPDANEMYAFTGNSILQFTTDKKFSYTLSTNAGSTNMNGSWVLAPDQKSITVTDAAQGSLRFDYRTETEFATEPIPITGGNAWIIYTKQ